MSRFCKGDIKKFVLMLWKVYLCNETLWPEKEEFHCNLNIDDITDTKYKYAKKVGKDFGMKNQSEYHDLHVQTSRKKLHWDIQSWSYSYPFSTGISRSCSLKKTKVKLELFTDGWKRDQRWICNTIYSTIYR